MKKIIISAFIAFTILTGVGCKKDTVLNSSVVASTDTSVSIIGKWNIITDSTFIYNQFGPTTIYVYTGVSTDYYDLRANDSIYIKEGNRLDTIKYWLPSGGPYIPIASDIFWGNITSLTSHSMTLDLPALGRTAEISTADIIHLEK
jgi:hypothetical protein